MIVNKIQDEYFNWMFQLVNAPDQYSYLLMHLDKIPFQYTLLRDGNREADGIDLRYRFGQECGYDNRLIASHLDVRPCTVLEMMTALALRCEEHIMNDPEIGDRTCVWFWKMIDSLGLYDETNDRFDEAHVDEIIDIFLNREYSRNGQGGLFTVKHSTRDMRCIEIWYQMHLYLNEYIDEGGDI